MERSRTEPTRNDNEVDTVALRDALRDLLIRLVDDKDGPGRKAIATRLGVHPRSLSYWLAGQRHVPAEFIPKLCYVLNNYRLLDLLEEAAGRVAYLVPFLSESAGTAEIKAVQKLVKEVGEALEALATTWQDGIVEQTELESTTSELDD